MGCCAEEPRCRAGLLASEGIQSPPLSPPAVPQMPNLSTPVSLPGRWCIHESPVPHGAVVRVQRADRSGGPGAAPGILCVDRELGFRTRGVSRPVPLTCLVVAARGLLTCAKCKHELVPSLAGGGGRYCHLCFADGETKAQGGEAACPRSHSLALTSECLCSWRCCHAVTVVGSSAGGWVAVGGAGQVVGAAEACGRAGWSHKKVLVVGFPPRLPCRVQWSSLGPASSNLL